MIIIGHLEAIADKNPYKKMNEYSVPFLLDSHKVRISLGLPHNGHEGSDKLSGQYVLFSVGGKLDFRINGQ